MKLRPAQVAEETRVERADPKQGLEEGSRWGRKRGVGYKGRPGV